MVIPFLFELFRYGDEGLGITKRVNVYLFTFLFIPLLFLALQVKISVFYEGLTE